MGMITHIQRFSVHNGPGIRSTVFFKGCSLRCAWCHNPETIRPEAQIQYFSHKCLGCGRCATVCPHGLHSFDGGSHQFSREGCVSCGNCQRACNHEAISISGREISAEEVLQIVERDMDYYRNSGGGLTLSGGEPLLQPDFAAEILHRAVKRGIHTALDTSANAPVSAVRPLIKHLSLVLLDLKCMDSEIHRRFTAAANGQVLKTAQFILAAGIPVEVRIPLVAGVNDSVENARETAAFLENYPHVIRVKLLPYHALGRDKAKSLGFEQQIFEAPDRERMAQIAEAFTQKAIKVSY